MKTTIAFRHLEPTDAIKQHVEDKIAKFKKYLINPKEAHVILSVEKFRQQCEVTLYARDFRATATETSDDLYKAIDLALHKMERQIRKRKEIIRDHHHRPMHETAAQAEEEFEASHS